MDQPWVRGRLFGPPPILTRVDAPYVRPHAASRSRQSLGDGLLPGEQALDVLAESLEDDRVRPAQVHQREDLLVGFEEPAQPAELEEDVLGGGGLVRRDGTRQGCVALEVAAGVAM